MVSCFRVLDVDCWLLVVCCWLVVVGCLLFVVNCWLFAPVCSLLAIVRCPFVVACGSLAVYYLTTRYWLLIVDC